MRTWAFAITLTGTLAVAGSAGAVCDLDEAGFSERRAALGAERGTLTDEARQALYGLRRAAEALERTGFDALCGGLRDAALDLIERESAWTAELAPAGDPGRTVGALNLVTFAATGRPVETAELVGRPVYSTAGEPLGRVDGVLLDQSRDASHLILSHGGFQAEDERLIAVPSARMLLDPAAGRLFAEIPATKLGDAPAYDRAMPWEPESNDAWYDERAAEAVATAAARARESRSAERVAADKAIAANNAGRDGPEEVVDGTPGPEDGPKRIRIEKDRPEQAVGSNN